MRNQFLQGFVIPNPTLHDNIYELRLTSIYYKVTTWLHWKISGQKFCSNLSQFIIFKSCFLGWRNWKKCSMTKILPRFFRFLEPVFQSFSACWAKYIIIQLNVCHFKQKWYKIVPNQQFLSSSFVRFFDKKCIDFKKKTEGWLLRLDFRYTCFVNVTFTFHFSNHRLLAFATLISIS